MKGFFKVVTFEILNPVLPGLNRRLGPLRTGWPGWAAPGQAMKSPCRCTGWTAVAVTFCHFGIICTVPVITVFGTVVTAVSGAVILTADVCTFITAVAFTVCFGTAITEVSSAV